MLIVRHYDSRYGEIEFMVADAKQLLVMVGLLEKNQIRYKVSNSQGLRRPEDFGFGGLEYWLSANETFE